MTDFTDHWNGQSCVVCGAAHALPNRVLCGYCDERREEKMERQSAAAKKYRQVHRLEEK